MLFLKFEWWPGAESNCRHADFQSAALPTELPGHIEPHDKIVKKRNYSKNADFYRVLALNLANICVPRRDGWDSKPSFKRTFGAGVEMS